MATGKEILNDAKQKMAKSGDAWRIHLITALIKRKWFKR